MKKFLLPCTLFWPSAHLLLSLLSVGTSYFVPHEENGVRHSFHFPSSYPQTYFLPTSILYDVRKSAVLVNSESCPWLFQGSQSICHAGFFLLFHESLLLCWVPLASFPPPWCVQDCLGTGGWEVPWEEPNGHNLEGCVYTDEEDTVTEVRVACSSCSSPPPTLPRLSLSAVSGDFQKLCFILTGVFGLFSLSLSHQSVPKCNSV